MFKKLKGKKYIRKTFKLGIILFLVYWFISLVHVWHLTSIHGDMFKKILLEDTWLGSSFGEVNRLRVLEFSEDFAIVYYSTIRGTTESDSVFLRDLRPRARLNGIVLHFRKINGQWQMGWWNGVWSRHGSADNFIWPLIR